MDNISLSANRLEQKKPYPYILLLFLAFYLVSGNITRFSFAEVVIPFPLAEVFLYVFIVKYLLIDREKICFDVFYLSLIFFISFLIGIFKNLFALDIASLALAFSYTIRICCILVLTYIIGSKMATFFTVKEVISYYMGLYYIQAFISLLILMFFPDSFELWKFLASINIYFPKGDPHQYRLISVFFDPNLYGALLILPVLLIFSKISYCRYELKNYVKMMFFLFLLCLTFSRSALIGVLIGIIFINFTALIGSVKNLVKIQKTLLNAAIIYLPLLFVFFFTRYIERFSDMSDDYSASSRWESLKQAITLLATDFNSVTGIGYGYFSLYRDYISGAEFNASLLNYVVCLGLPLAVLGSVYLKNIIGRSLKYYKSNEYHIYLALLAYLLSLFIITVFNNWLFIPFFLFTIGPILVYGYVKNERAQNTLNSRFML